MKIQISLKSDKNTLHEDVCTFMLLSRLILLRMRNVSGKSCRENQNSHFVLNKLFPKFVPCMT